SQHLHLQSARSEWRRLLPVHGLVSGHLQRGAESGPACLIRIPALSQFPGRQPGNRQQSQPRTGQVGQPYNSSFIVTGGVSPYTFSIINGSLPPGLTLNPTTGALTGTPTTA